MNKKYNKCVFLDRDGTIIVDKGYTVNKDEFEFIDNVPMALKEFKVRGYLLIVISNQSGIARGYFNVKQVAEFNDHINDKLYELAGVKIDAFYFCPHYEYGIIQPYNKKCHCRKPNPGLIYKAQEEYNINLDESYFFGDKLSDIGLSRYINFKGIYLVDSEKTIATFVNEIK